MSSKKPSPIAALASLTDEQADALYTLLLRSPYHAAKKFIREQWCLDVSISALSRWYAAQGSKRTRADIRAAIKASQQFERGLDGSGLDGTEKNAIVTAYWQAVTARDIGAIETFGKLILDFNKDSRDTEKLQRVITAEKRAETLAAENAELKARLETLENALKNAGKTKGQVDTLAVANAVDQMLGVKK